MTKRFFLACLGILIFSLGEIVAQDAPIYLNNASFEDFPRPGKEPRGWYDCGAINFPEETAPDVHPVEGTPAFGVSASAQDGDTYLGMVVRENDSWESVAQRLTVPMQAGKCYTFSIQLATSKTYNSILRGTNREASFTNPVKLRIWGGAGYCRRDELLAESKLVTHSDWQEYEFKFEPKRRLSYIVLEAFFKTPTLSPPNGNLLLDNASAIQPIPCDEELPLVKKPEVDITNPSGTLKKVEQKTYELIAKVMNVKEKRKVLLKVNGRNIRNFNYNSSTNRLTAKVKLREGRNKIFVKAANSAGNASDETSIIYERSDEPVTIVEKPKEQISRIEEDLVKLKPGETLRVDELFFEIDSYEIADDSRPVLNDIYKFLQKNGRVKVEIGGHTNRNCDTQYCNELSNDRAKSVVDYLVQKGINSKRLAYKGYGKTKPLTFSKSASAQKKNQRVEIKILSLGS